MDRSSLSCVHKSFRKLRRELFDVARAAWTICSRNPEFTATCIEDYIFGLRRCTDCYPCIVLRLRVMIKYVHIVFKDGLISNASLSQLDTFWGSSFQLDPMQLKGCYLASEETRSSKMIRTKQLKCIVILGNRIIIIKFRMECIDRK